jgi:hypothetical protein
MNGCVAHHQTWQNSSGSEVEEILNLLINFPFISPQIWHNKLEQ